MTIKDLVMPVNYFNLDNVSFALNSVMYSLAGIILVVSIIFEFLNDRDILGPIKRFLVAIILLTIALPVQNFVVEKSFAVADVLMNSLSDSEKLEMINDPGAFMDKLSAMQFKENTSLENEEEEVGEDGLKAMVSSSKINFSGVIFDQLKNIPNIIMATITFGFISWCLYSLQASYYVLYFVSGALFAIPAILSIFPAFESSLSGAFKSLGTLFVMPIFVALIASMLSLKMAEFGNGHLSAGDSIHNVAIVACLCFALGSSIFISAGFLVASGISQNLGATGGMATAAVMNGAINAGSSVFRNREVIFNSAKKIAGGMRTTASISRNTAINSGSILKNTLNNTAAKAGALGAIARPINKSLNKVGLVKSHLEAKKEGVKTMINRHTDHSSSLGQAGKIIKSIHKSPENFKKVSGELSSIKKSGFKNIRPTGTIEAKKFTELRKMSLKKPEMKNTKTNFRPLGKSSLLYNHQKNFKSDLKFTPKEKWKTPRFVNKNLKRENYENQKRV